VDRSVVDIRSLAVRKFLDLCSLTSFRYSLSGVDDTGSRNDISSSSRGSRTKRRDLIRDGEFSDRSTPCQWYRKAICRYLSVAA
jgi:hypothetical protein